ncbi:VanW family protein, partial [bacterium]|nr:VanW family protein [bacterium]
LCQVATTLFRTALNAGLPIEERHPHAYRVRYYEPPIGMDATIYYPQRDLKFKNDTGSPILIQSEVVGYRITFYFYGRSDGRKAVISKPVAYDFTPPPPPTYIEDPNLAPGQEVYEERSHWGAKAYFYYRVYKEGKLIYEKKFFTHYKAWPAIIRRGPTQT